MDEETKTTNEPKVKKKFKLPAWLIVCIAVIAVFGAGIGIEAYHHSEGYLKKMLEENESSFLACAEYFVGDDVLSLPVEVTQSEDSESGKTNVSLTSIGALEDIYEDEEIYDDIKKLDECGIIKITAEEYGSTYEIKFYIDVNSGFSYITDECKESYGYVPDGYFDSIHIKGNWYTFGIVDEK